METKTDTPMALAGVRVVEMGQLIAGPFCGKTLAVTNAGSRYPALKSWRIGINLQF